MMSHPVIPDSARPCLWMSAGLLTYRLCDRDFDCERCPLDAALRRGELVGSRDHEALLAPDRDTSDFPEDRRYTAGHGWVQVLEGQGGGRLRLGLDTFAAAIIGRCGGIAWNPPGRSLAQGDPICRLDLGLGAMWIGAPLAGFVVKENPALQDHSEQLVTASYTEGWIAEFQAGDMAGMEQLVPAELARERSRLDLQRFRRRVAMHLLADDAGRVGRTLADGGELLTDLRQMLGGPKYLDIIREFIY
jgi:glycine cleavage system H lipoate-binding protein